jgi:hypothetical protein
MGTPDLAASPVRDGRGGRRVSELFATLREAVATLAAADPKLTRFGAATHRYQLLPPVDAAALAPLAQLGPLPDDYRDYVTQLSAGGAGPYHGLLPAPRLAPIAAPRGITVWQRALPIAHLGCGYAALLVLDGDARGEVWISAGSIVGPIRPSFTVFVVDWIDRLSHARWLDGFVPPDACALANALTGYLDHCERRRGLASGTLDGDALREDLADLGPGAIQLAAGASVLFAPADPVDPCVTCVQLIERMAAQGLRRDVVAPGILPLPQRT